MHLYSNWALILRTGTRILQDTNYRATLFLLTELLYSKILHIGSESSPLVLPFHYCYIQLCERPYWYRLECPFPLHGKKKKKNHYHHDLPAVISRIHLKLSRACWVFWFPFFSFPSHSSRNSTSVTCQQKTPVQVKSCKRWLNGISNLIKQKLNPRIALNVNPVLKIFSLEEALLWKGKKNKTKQVNICMHVVRSTRDKHLQIIMLSF